MLLFCFVVFVVHASIFCLCFSQKQSANQAKKIQGNVVLLNWKAHEKIQALLKEKKFTWKSHLRPSCTKPFNYWMRLSMISWIIKTEVCVICWSRVLRQITQTRGFDNSWYHAKTEFNKCFIIHFSHNSSWETEVKCSAILFLRRTLQGA